ncbi:uncharacterized protein LOC126577332, partial [Anopheles aquasalis]|uniref:uncharacterized protein LOC126577332 n=1 Tax=Anopheles aquasalis TaxID=42839 RepID=UPI00215AD0EA
NRKMKETSALLRNRASPPWPMVLVLNALPEDCVVEWQSSHPEIELKAAANRFTPRLRPVPVTLEEKWIKFDLPPLDQFKRNRLQPMASVEIEIGQHLSRLNDSTRNIFDSTTPDVLIGEMSDILTETRVSDQKEPSIDYRCSQDLVKPERDAEGDEKSDTSYATVGVGHRFNMPVAREVLPSQESVCYVRDTELREPVTQELFEDSDEDMFLEINQTLKTNEAKTPPTRYGCSGVTPGPDRLHGSPIARSSPFIPNMMLRSPSIFARLSNDLLAPRLNLQRLQISRKSLFSQKRLPDDMEEAGSCRSVHERSNDDDDDDSVIRLRRPTKARRITDTPNNAIEQHDTSDEDRTLSPARLKKIARGFICAEAEASDDFETEAEESKEEDDSFIVRDSQVVQGTPVFNEHAMYLRSVRDIPRAGAFYFPDRQRQPLPMDTSPMSVDNTYSQQDTYDQSFLDQEARADSQLSELELLEAKLETKKTRKRTISDTSE